jgi:two-component system CheB/CheR fusion protein
VPDKGFPIVGIGASAGGLAALEAFFSAMPAETESGMAFVLVQHLAPDHKSILSDLVKRYTRMQVFEVTDGMEVKPNCAYIIPPNRDMALLNGTLQLLEPAAPRGLRLPVDFFFRSLAKEQRERAICIVLSGTGSDGTLGVRAIKGEGGMVIVQAPDSTEHDGMPNSAISTGLVDYVLPPAKMPAQLIAYVNHSFRKRVLPVSVPSPKNEDTMRKICVLLRAQTGHDFSQYKQNTVMRRVERRMALHQIERPEEYLRFLQKNSSEGEALFRDLLIGVTSFFRDPGAFSALQTQVLPGLFAGKAACGPVRIWVCGCSTGEEAYSIAILIREQMESLQKDYQVQIFATDIDKQAIEQARSGVFPSSIAADIPPDRISRFFSLDQDGGAYRVKKAIRDLLIFSEQDVVRDPPFSKLDLISCRNLLIYMGGELQKKIIPLFHYALNPEGVLFLGNSETVGEFATLFTPLDRKWKLYRRGECVSGLPLLMQEALAQPPAEGGAHVRGAKRESPVEKKGVLRRMTEQSLLQHYAQTGVLVDAQGDIRYVYGRTGKYLELAPGDAGTNILRMGREGLRRELTTALHKVVSRKEPVSYPGLRVRTNGDVITVNLAVKPADTGDGGAAVPDLFLVILEEATPPSAALSGKSAAEDAGTSDLDTERRIAALEQELRAKEEFLQSTIEEMETANEELKSTNEEMQSVNEELQSTNEELETSKEELQSINEELATVNTELQNKVADLARANDDMNNLISGTGVGTIFVDHQLRVIRFTPGATRVINLIETDIGRPIGHIVSNMMGYDRLVEDMKEVLESLASREVEVQTKAGEWYMMRIRPYRTLENVIEGTVVVFVDITDRKRMEAEVEEARLREAELRKARARFTQNIVATVREPLLVLDKDLYVVFANRAFFGKFQVEPGETLGHMVYDLGNHQWNIPKLRQLLGEILPRDAAFDDFEVTHEFEKIGRRTILLNARRISSDEDEEIQYILLAMEDITQRM